MFAPDGFSPLPGALLDVWQADASGVYDNHAATRDDDRFVLRGRLLTDEEGRFEVRTILPEGYLLAQGYRRPKHIHLKVSHPDVVGVLTTQLYFAGDPYNATDPFVVPSLIVELRPDEAAAPGDPAFFARFDVVLSPGR